MSTTPDEAPDDYDDDEFIQALLNAMTEPITDEDAANGGILPFIIKTYPGRLESIRLDKDWY